MHDWIRIASLDECPPGGSCECVIEDRLIALFNVEGQLFAMDGICPHQGGPLAQGRVTERMVTCPWHGWQFDISGNRPGSGANPAPICYPVKMDGSDILVRLDPDM